VATGGPRYIFVTFNWRKIAKIANCSTNTEAREIISTDLESLEFIKKIDVIFLYKIDLLTICHLHASYL
jgi:hypothetical protein